MKWEVPAVLVWVRRGVGHESDLPLVKLGETSTA